jgi:hypothetical protein
MFTQHFEGRRNKILLCKTIEMTFSNTLALSVLQFPLAPDHAKLFSIPQLLMLSLQCFKVGGHLLTYHHLVTTSKDVSCLLGHVLKPKKGNLVLTL